MLKLISMFILMVCFASSSCAENCSKSSNSSSCDKVYDITKFQQLKDKSQPNLLKNGSFEEGRKGWSFTKGDVVGRPLGRNGSSCLLYSRKNRSQYSLISQRIPTKPNTRYEFGVWVKTKDIKGVRGRGAGVCIEYYDKATGKYVKGDYNFPLYQGTKDWTEISGKFTAPEGVYACIVLYMYQGMVGDAFFDDVYVRPVRPLWDVYMCNPAYNTIALDVPGESVARFNVTSNSTVPEKKKLVLQLSLDNGFKVASKVENGLASFDFSKAGLAMGRTYECNLAVLDIAKKTVLFQDKFPLQVRSPESGAKAPGSVVRFTKNNVAIVNGKRFMPLGFFVDIASAKNIELTKQAGGNVLMPYNSYFGVDEKGIKNTRALLDKMHAAGIMSIFSIKDFYRPDHNYYTKSWKGSSKLADVRGGIVQAVRDHPAILAWFINDEIHFEKRQLAVDFRQQVNQLDPDHPTFGTNFDYGQFSHYGPGWDIAGINPYPIARRTFKLSYVQNAANQASKTRQPVWCAPEAFHNATYEKIPGVKFQMPTEKQIRGMMLQMAGQGVKGFVLYKLDDTYPPRAPEEGMFERFWPGMCRTFKLFRELEPYITSDHQPQSVSTSAGKGKVGAYRLTDDNQREIIILTVLENEGEAVINVENPSEWQSRYGKTTVRDGKLVFKGTAMDSDVLFKVNSDSKLQ